MDNFDLKKYLAEGRLLKENLILETQSFTLDKTTTNFIDNKITESQFLDYLNSSVLNEGILDKLKGFYNKFKEKAIKILMTFLKKAAKVGFAIFGKMKTFINWILGILKKWKKENPALFKAIVITLLIIILLMASASTAHAQSSGIPVSPGNIDMAIGYLKELREVSGDIDNMSLMKGMGYLVDLKDGTLDIPLSEFGNEAIAAAKAAMTTTKSMANDANIAEDKELMSKCISLMNSGAEYIKVIFEKAGNSESIKLIMK